jgi:ATP-dependent RNA helicase RhlB
MGFAEDLRWILRQMPNPKDRQSLMFTATLSQRVMTLGWRQMNNPVEVIVRSEHLTPDSIHQVLYHVATREKLSLLIGLLQREGSSRTMIFVNTRYRAQRLVDDLRRHGYSARGLTGSVVQTKWLRVLDDFRDGTLPILVATDVASRGLHIEGVSHVINYDLPQDAEDYVHRIGRTARVGAEGKAITLACEDYVYSIDAIQRFVGYELPTEFADDGLYAQLLPREPRPRRNNPRPERSSHRAPASSDTPSTEGETKPQKRRRRRRRKKPTGEAPEGNS